MIFMQGSILVAIENTAALQPDQSFSCRVQCWLQSEILQLCSQINGFEAGFNVPVGCNETIAALQPDQCSAACTFPAPSAMTGMRHRPAAVSRPAEYVVWCICLRLILCCRSTMPVSAVLAIDAISACKVQAQMSGSSRVVGACQPCVCLEQHTC